MKDKFTPEIKKEIVRVWKSIPIRLSGPGELRRLKSSLVDKGIVKEISLTELKRILDDLENY